MSYVLRESHYLRQNYYEIYQLNVLTPVLLLLPDCNEPWMIISVSIFCEQCFEKDDMITKNQSQFGSMLFEFLERGNKNLNENGIIFSKFMKL